MTEFEIEHYRDVKWAWPLQIALSPRMAHFKEQLLFHHWPQEFTEMVVLSEEEKDLWRHFNIVFLHWDDRENDFLELSIDSADVVIIVESFLGGPSISDYLNKPRRLFPFYEQCGVFFIGLEQNISDWFNSFIVELSHDENVVDALKKTISDGYLFYDPELFVQTKLTYLAQQLIELLQPDRFSQYMFTISQRDGEKRLTVKEIRERLEMLGSDFDFGSESHYASEFVIYSRELFKILGPQLKYQRRGSIGSVDDANAEYADFEPYASNYNVNGNGDIAEKINESLSLDAPRYLQAKVLTDKNELVPEKLQRDADYILQVRIGFEGDDFKNAAGEFDAAAVFEDSDKAKEEIILQFLSNTSTEQQYATIELPRFGNSTATDFSFRTNKKNDPFEAEILAYHNNRLLQHMHFSAATVDGNPLENGVAQQLTVIFCTRKNLGGLNQRTEFTASLVLDLNRNQEATLNGMAGKKALNLPLKADCRDILLLMKGRLQKALGNPAKHPADLMAEGNQELLRFLARKGYLLHSKYFRFAELPEGNIQLVTADPEYLPVEFVYTLPAPDKENSVICPNAVAALKEGKCCGSKRATIPHAEHICPFGFWGLSRVIERHNYGKAGDATPNYCLRSEPTDGRASLQVLQKAVFAASKRVDQVEPNTIAQLEKLITFHAGQNLTVPSWKEWRQTVEVARPDSMILVVHIEKDEDEENQLEIGDRDFVLQGDIGTDVLLKDNLKPAPFVIVFGCESTNLESPGFDISSQFMVEGAAIVVSNFTKLKGNHAKDLINDLLSFIQENNKRESLFGETALKLRQHLLAEGKIVGLTLIAQGDADWKIKN